MSHPLPKGLSPAAKAFWLSVIDEYELEPVGFELLELACRAMDRAAQARKTLDREGLTVPTHDGSVKAHPAVSIERAANHTFMKAIRELGINEDERRSPGRPASGG